MAAGRRRRAHLNSSTVWQGCGEQRMFAVDALVRGGGNLSCKAPQGRVVESVNLAALDARGRFQPKLAWTVDVKIRDVWPRERLPKRR
jgi:hypothetical protein